MYIISILQMRKQTQTATYIQKSVAFSAQNTTSLDNSDFKMFKVQHSSKHLQSFHMHLLNTFYPGA